TGARFRRAEGVELERHTLQAEHAPEARRKRDELRVDLGLRESERLDAQLVELAIAAFLRLFAPEHRAAAPELLLLVVQEAVAQRRAHHAGRRLGPHRDAFAVAVLERVHLL